MLWLYCLTQKQKQNTSPCIKLKATMKKATAITLPELLAPAGNLEKLKTAVHYGADAVYMGGKSFSLRAKAGNFSLEDMAKGVEFAHEHQVKVYITINIFAHNNDFEGLAEYLLELSSMAVDGLIISDPGILAEAKRVVPELELHLSTQANLTNAYSAKFWFSQGVTRLNLARELSFQEICEIKEQVEGELEVFVHGALCISYSGRCMLSNYMTDRDANQGKCSHPCRFSYALMEEKRPGEFFPVEEDERGTYIFNSKDLCLLHVLPQLVAAGVDSLKIEGRMKSVFYVGGVVRVYRAALIYLASLPQKVWEKPQDIALPTHLFEELEKLGTRGVTENFFFTPPTAKDMLYESSRAQQLMEPVGIVRETGERLLIEVRNTLFTEEIVTLMDHSFQDQEVTVISMVSEKGATVEKAHPGNRIYLETSPTLVSCAPNSIIRRNRV